MDSNVQLAHDHYLSLSMPKAALKSLLKGIDCLAKIKFESKQYINKVVAMIKIPEVIGEGSSGAKAALKKNF